MYYIVIFVILLVTFGYLVENNYFKYIVKPYIIAIKPNKYIKQVELDINNSIYPETLDLVSKHKPDWPNNNRFVYPFYSESYLKAPYYTSEFSEYTGAPRPYHLLDNTVSI
jgi:hypothetical protein